MRRPGSWLSVCQRGQVRSPHFIKTWKWQQGGEISVLQVMVGVDRYVSLGRWVNPNTFLEAGNFLSALNTRGSLQVKMQATERQREKEGCSGRHHKNGAWLLHCLWQRSGEWQLELILKNRPGMSQSGTGVLAERKLRGPGAGPADVASERQTKIKPDTCFHCCAFFVHVNGPLRLWISPGRFHVQCNCSSNKKVDPSPLTVNVNYFYPQK